MNKIALIFLCILLNACTWNGVHISVLPDGNYSIIYESIGIKSDLENKDFGKIMGFLKQNYNNKIDMNLASKIIKNIFKE